MIFGTDLEQLVITDIYILIFVKMKESFNMYE